MSIPLPASPRRDPSAYLLAGCGVFFVLLMAAVGVGIYFVYQSVGEVGTEVKAEGDRLFRAIDEGTFASTYTMLTTPEFRQYTSAAEYEQLGRALKDRLGKFKSNRLKTSSMQRLNANLYVDVLFDVQFEKGAAKIKATFKQSDHEWRLRSFEVTSPKLLKHNAEVKCPNCGQLYSAGAPSCPHCGATAEDTITPRDDESRDQPPDAGVTSPDG